MRVEVIKIGKYDPTQEGKYSKYEGYSLSTNERADFPITPQASRELSHRPRPVKGLLYHSPLLRGKQSAESIAKEETCQVRELTELKEVPFKLEKLLSEAEFNDQGSNLVRARFVEAFVDNALLETRSQIEERINIIIGLMTIIDAPTVTLISHSFFMKMLEATVKGKNIFAQPELLADVIPPDQKTYNFGEGFIFRVKK